MFIQSEVGQGRALNASEGLLTYPKIINFEKHLAGINEYKRELNDKEFNILAKRVLEIKDKATYDQAYAIMTSKDALVLGGHIEYRLPEDAKIKEAVKGKYPEKVISK